MKILIKDWSIQRKSDKEGHEKITRHSTLKDTLIDTLIVISSLYIILIKNIPKIVFLI